MNQCLICLEDLDEELGDIIFIECGCNIRYHKVCLLKWLRFAKKCPICKKNVIFFGSYESNSSYPTLLYTCLIYGSLTIYMIYAHFL